MRMIKTPRIVRNVYRDYVWKIRTTEPEIFLTFDDGPTPEVTEWVLQLLDQYNAKATFFCIGNNVVANPELYNLIKQKGHMVGNHTFDHVKGWSSKNEEYLRNIEKGQEVIQSKLFRPPYGKIKRSQARYVKKDFKIIMWDVITYDYDGTIDTDSILKKVINATESGSIVVFHDSVKAFKNLKKLLPAFLDHFFKKQYTFRSIELPLYNEVN